MFLTIRFLAVRGVCCCPAFIQAVFFSIFDMILNNIDISIVIQRINTKFEQTVYNWLFLLCVKF